VRNGGCAIESTLPRKPEADRSGLRCAV